MKQHFLLLALLALGRVLSLSAQNPIIRTHYSADPAPLVVGDTLYVYYDRDEGVTPSGDVFFYMREWRVASTTDMVNWREHGVALPLSTFKWASDGSAWASQCIARNGKYYWYVCADYPGRWHAVGVAVSDTPTGPFRDALGKPLISTGTMGDIDPTVFIDDDGQAYLYFGNNKLCYVKLNADMISYDRSVGQNGIVTVSLTAESFGGVKVDGTVQGENCYEEGPWLTKRNGLYYLLYAAGGVPENLAYSTSESPTGPWKYRGKLMPVSATNSFTNHCGVVDFKGRSYLFYHTGWRNEGNGGGGFTRSIAVQDLSWNPDGSLPLMQPSRKGVAPVGTLNPYQRVAGATYNNAVGVTTGGDERVGVYASMSHTNDSLSVALVDFGEEGAQSISMTLSDLRNLSRINVFVADDAPYRIATIVVPQTGDHAQRETVTVNLNRRLTGVHRIRFVHFSSYETRLYDWQFHRETAETVAIRGLELSDDVSATGAQVASRQRYTLDGRRAGAGLRGLLLEQTTYADGTRRVEKLLR
jgi:hypothetical protein